MAFIFTSASSPPNWRLIASASSVRRRRGNRRRRRACHRRSGEALLNIGQPDIVGPAIATDRDRVAAAIVRAHLVQTASLFIAHLACRDCGRGWLTPAAVASVAASVVFSVIAPKEIRRTSPF